MTGERIHIVKIGQQKNKIILRVATSVLVSDMLKDALGLEYLEANGFTNDFA